MQNGCFKRARLPTIQLVKLSLLHFLLLMIIGKNEIYPKTSDKTFNVFIVPNSGTCHI